MKILFINICLRPYLEPKMPPVGLGYIMTSVQNAGFEFELLDIDAHRYSDEQVKKIINEKEFDIAAFGCIVTGYKIIKWLSEVIKEKNKNIMIIAGNSVASSIPDILLSKTLVDVAVMSEGDITIVDLLNAIKDKAPLNEVKGIYFKSNGEIIKTPERELIKDLDTLPNINWDLFDIEQYLEKSRLLVNEPYLIDYNEIRAWTVNSARGCPHRCGFCYNVFRGQKYRFRSGKSIAQEVASLKDKYGINYILFNDELTLYSKKRCLEMSEAFIDAGVNDVIYHGDVRADLLGETEEDFQIAKKLKQAGFHFIGYSLESAEPSILKEMNKKISVDMFISQTKILKKAGIYPFTSIVLGYPQETRETIKKTFDVCGQVGIYPSVGYLTPQPNTPVYDYAKKVGKILDDEKYLIDVIGDRQDLRINLTTLTNDEFQETVLSCLKTLSKQMDIFSNDSDLIKTGHYMTSSDKS